MDVGYVWTIPSPSEHTRPPRECTWGNQRGPAMTIVRASRLPPLIMIMMVMTEDTVVGGALVTRNGL